MPAIFQAGRSFAGTEVICGGLLTKIFRARAWMGTLKGGVEVS